MTNKTKTLFVIAGLIACLIIALLAKAEAGQSNSETTGEINRPAALTQVIVSNGTQWFIQSTSKLLKPIQ